MSASTRSRAIAAGITALVAVGATAGTATAAEADDSETDDALTLRDSLYVLPLGPVVATPECLLVLCPVVQPFAPVGSGPDAGATGLRVSGFPLAPAGVIAEARSEPLPYDGAGEKGTVSVAFSVDRVGEGTGGSAAATSVTLQEVGGGTIADLPQSALPLDGERRTIGPVAIDPKAMTLGRSYVAVARFLLSAPSGASVSARMFAPRLVALGPKKAVKAPAKLKARAPITRLAGRRLRVTGRCPAGSFRCDLQIRASLNGKTLRKGSADLQAASRHTFTYRLSARELRRVRRAGRITTTLRVETEAGRSGSSRSTLRVPKG